jgi:hypothetical protein
MSRWQRWAYGGSDICVIPRRAAQPPCEGQIVIFRELSQTSRPWLGHCTEGRQPRQTPPGGRNGDLACRLGFLSWLRPHPLGFCLLVLGLCVWLSAFLTLACGPSDLRCPAWLSVPLFAWLVVPRLACADGLRPALRTWLSSLSLEPLFGPPFRPRWWTAVLDSMLGARRSALVPCARSRLWLLTKRDPKRRSPDGVGARTTIDLGDPGWLWSAILGLVRFGQP